MRINQKNRLLVIFGVSFTITVVFIFLIIFVANKIYTKSIYEEIIIEKYLEKKEKYELLHSLVDDVIVENEGIKEEKIPKDKVDYKIIPKNENIIFSYILKDNSTNNGKYSAVITLSNNYSILESKYSLENMETLIEFRINYIKFTKLVSYLCSLAIFISIYIIILLIFIIIDVIFKHRYKLKRK